MADKTNAKKMINEYEQVWSELMIEKFFHLVKYDPLWKRYAVTFGSMFYHRNELMRRVIEDSKDQSKVERRDDWEY